MSAAGWLVGFAKQRLKPACILGMNSLEVQPHFIPAVRIRSGKLHDVSLVSQASSRKLQLNE
jgi:hypothetical protein